MTGRVPRRPVTHSPGGVGACCARGGGFAAVIRCGVGSGEAGVSSGSRDFHAGRKCSNKRGVVRAGTYRLSRRPARIGGADTLLLDPDDIPAVGLGASRASSVLQRRPPARQEGRKDVKQNRWWSAIDLGSWARTLAGSGVSPRRAPGTSPRAMAASIPEWREKHPADMSYAATYSDAYPDLPQGAVSDATARRLRRKIRAARRGGEKRSSRSGTRANHRAGELAGGEGL